MNLKERIDRRNFLRRSAEFGIGLGAAFLAESFPPLVAKTSASSFERFFPETKFSVRDEEAPFLSGFERFGGLETFGFPISRSYQQEGKFCQAFQRGILKWEPQTRNLGLAPVMNWLHQAGRDSWLQSLGIPPVKQGNYTEKERFSWLVNEGIKGVYLQNPRLYGLPTSEPHDSGVYAIQRFENYAFQLWQKEIPGMPKPGTVVGILAGEYAKQAGLIPSEALVPESPVGLKQEKISRGEIIRRGPWVPKVAVTIDDGWWPEQIEKAVEIAEKHGIKLTFFVVGRLLQMEKWRQPIERALAAGHELQNHTFNHLDLCQCDSATITWEIKAAQEAIWKRTDGKGNSGRYFRPPYGGSNDNIVRIAHELGLEVVKWSNSSGGTEKQADGKLVSAEQCLANLEAGTGWGSISLLHTNRNDIDALKSYLPWLEKKGMSPVLLSELVPFA